MAWSETYKQIVDALRVRNGSYDTETPKMRLADMTATLGVYVLSMREAIDRVADGVVRSDFVDSEGGLQLSIDLSAATMDTLDTTAYISQTTGIPNAPWKRTPTHLTDLQLERAQVAGITPDAITYEPVRNRSIIRNDQLELIGFVRTLMADYQRALDASARAAQLYLLGFASRDACAVFLSSVRSMGADLDVLAENPPTTLGEDIRGALGNAINKSEAALTDAGKLVGKAAAEIGNVAGDVAGSFTSGFFEQAGLVTLLVAGVAAWVAFH